ncbi:flavin reductase family protein [Arenibacterium sp. LLYu02]|uniref:flavin reductase family protein n=1 Tax=Arenibacterium sp. LLYu02 TaxID=3404132 RepID=UPI003B227737
MALLGSSVNIITSDGPAGRLGYTATAVSSVCDTPPSLLICMNRSSQQNEPLKENGVFCVNVLSSRHQDLSAAFAGVGKMEMPERFRMGDWERLLTGAPALVGAVVSFDCRIAQVVEVGTHSLIIADVVALRQDHAVNGLVYFDRKYHELKLGA